MQKYLLCRPQGGLNDIFCEIENCCRYAEKYNRQVVVDTAYQTSTSFWDTFANYSVSKQKFLALDVGPYIEIFQSLSVFPKSIQGCFNTYKAVWPWDQLTTSGILNIDPPRFNFHMDYEERLLVHHQFSLQKRRELSPALGKRISLQKNLLRELVERLELLGDRFSAVHVRHTDLQSNYHDLIESLKSSSLNNIFVATDNRQVLQDFYEALGHNRIKSFSTLPANAGRTLHHTKQQDISQATANSDAILDLFTLTFAEHFSFGTINNKPTSEHSGFSILAKTLQENPLLRNEFLVQPPYQVI